MDDRAPVGGHHVPQGRQGAVDLAEIGHVRYPPELVGAGLLHRGVDRHHRVVDPDVDAAALPCDSVGDLLQGIGVRYVGGEGDGAAAEVLDIADRRREADLAPVTTTVRRLDMGAGISTPGKAIRAPNAR